MVKLDLINARLDPNFGPRVYDSLEDANFNHPKDISKSFSQISFKSKEPKILYAKRNAFVPNVFSNAVVDNRGNFLDMADTVHPRVKNKPLKTEDSNDPPITTSTSLYAPTLDRIKDKIHDDNRENLFSRVVKKKLPGATWAVASREERVYPSNTGPGYYEVYKSQLADNIIRLGSSGPTGRGESSDFVRSIPIKTRRRLEKIEKARAAEMALKSSASRSRLSASASSITEEPSNKRDVLGRDMEGSGVIRFSDAPRFEAPEYKQEPYVKTTGMILSPNFDKSFDKKITFSMRPDSPPKDQKKSNGALTGNIDVDVGHMFAIASTVKRSPVKYAAAFRCSPSHPAVSSLLFPFLTLSLYCLTSSTRSNAKVGMEIPPTVSPDYIGPGSFPGAYPDAITIREPHKPSPSFQRRREFWVPPALGDSVVPLRPFAIENTAGPVFSKEGASFDKNAQLAKIVQEKMAQIYPRLASKKFGADTVNSSWGEDDHGLSPTPSQSMKGKASGKWRRSSLRRENSAGNMDGGAKKGGDGNGGEGKKMGEDPVKSFLRLPYR